MWQQIVETEKGNTGETDVPSFNVDRSEDMKKLRFESKKVGEALMQLFESLDGLECCDQTQRSRRKQVATKINSALDKNEFEFVL